MSDDASTLASLAARWTGLAERKPTAENHRKAAEAHRAAAVAFNAGRGGPVAKIHRALADAHDGAATQLDLGVGSVHTGGTIGDQRKAIVDGIGGSLKELDAALHAAKAGLMSDTTQASAAAADQRAARKAKRLADKQARDEKRAAKKKDGRSRVPSSIHIRADIAPGGAIHVRHNLKAGEFMDGEGQPLLLSYAEDAGSVWIQLAKQGSFAGHPSGRPFKLDTTVFKQMITNFRANKDGRLPIDFEHASEQHPTEGSIPQGGAPAQGWIVDLKLEADGNLYAKVEWSTLARQYIREGKYRFISPAIHFKMKDRVTNAEIGAYISSAGLTNQPFLDGMRPLAARATPAGAGGEEPTQLGAKDFLEQTLRAPDDYMPGVRAALGMHELSTHAECSEQLARLSERCSLADATGMHEGVDLRAKYLNSLAECAGVGGSATMQDILDAVQDMIDAAIERHEETYHEGGGANLSAHQPTNTATPTPPSEEHAMADKSSELIAAETKITQLDTELTTLKGTHTSASAEVTTLKSQVLELGSASAELVTLCKTAGYAPKEGESTKQLIERVLADNATLLKAKTDRDEADIVSDVERAMECYGPNGLKQVTNEQKPDLLTLRRESPKAFQGLYKPLTSDEIRLLTRDVARRPVERKPAPIDGKVMLSHAALTAQLMSRDKIGYSEASDKAALMIRESADGSVASAAGAGK